MKGGGGGEEGGFCWVSAALLGDFWESGDVVDDVVALVEGDEGSNVMVAAGRRTGCCGGCGCSACG